MAIDAAVQRIIDDALDEKGFSEGELKYLFKLDPESDEFKAVYEASEIIRKRYNKGTMLAQIGVDSQPCPGNCFHCSFSARYNTRPRDQWFLPNESIVDYAEEAVNYGTNMITLMLTAAYKFDSLIELLDQIHERIGEFPIMMNMGDFTYDQAVQMKEHGVTAVFHGIRMGEGLVTSIPLERRFETYAAANAVGFKIGASIENITPIFTDDAIARMMMRMHDEVRPMTCGCTSKRLVEGTAGFNEPDFPPEKLTVYQKAFRLLMSGVLVTQGGTMYSECGNNPRDWVQRTEVNGLIKKRGTSHESLKKWMIEEGYDMEPEGPSQIWGF